MYQCLLSVFLIAYLFEYGKINWIGPLIISVIGYNIFGFIISNASKYWIGPLILLFINLIPVTLFYIVYIRSLNYGSSSQEYICYNG